MNSKKELVKRLLRENIEELNRNTRINGLTINFENDNFYIYDNNEVILRGDLSKINEDFESQKKFILNVAEKKTVFAKVLEDMDENDFKNLIKIDNKIYFDVLGYGDIYKNNLVVLDDYDVNKIKNYLNGDKIRVVLYKSENRTGFYIDGIIHKDTINLSFKEYSEDKIKEITLYYKIISEKEIEDVIDFLF